MPSKRIRVNIRYLPEMSGIHDQRRIEGEKGSYPSEITLVGSTAAVLLITSGRLAAGLEVGRTNRITRFRSQAGFYAQIVRFRGRVNSIAGWWVGPR